MNTTIRRIVTGILSIVTANTCLAADFYVAAGGNDKASGAKETPLATLETARDAARQAGAGPHRIVLIAGDYFLSKPLELDQRDNGLTLEGTPGGKISVYGGRLVTGWQRDGEHLFYADLPGVTDGTWDFRALVVAGRLAERARLPESGTLQHQSTFDVAPLPAVAGYWARQPTPQERTSMRYDPKDIPAGFDARNAELRIYHMWDESLVGIVGNDTQSHTFALSTPALFPPGAFGIKKYVIFNTREGLIHPGQWYLDRTAGRVVYWPLPDEDVSKLQVIAPVLERVIGITGTRKASVENITIRGLAIQATTTPLKPAGFAALQHYDGALHIERAKKCVVEDVEVCNVGGLGMLVRDVTDCQIRRCQIHHVGAGGASFTGSGTEVASNHVHHVGIYHPSAAGMGVYHYKSNGEAGLRVQRNEVHDGPYCGIIGGGEGLQIEENLVYHVMQEMHDGAGIYGNMRRSTVRRNVVRDIVPHGEGFGVSAYYLDEGSEQMVIEKNVSLGIERPTHNHISSDITIRDNVFVADRDMRLSFQRSSGVTFTNNMLIAPGKIAIVQPNAIRTWSDNLVVREGLDKAGVPKPFTIDDSMPVSPAPGRRTEPVSVLRAPAPPKFVGDAGWDDWPGTLIRIDREPTRWSAIGAPAFARVTYDDHYLYVAVNVVVFDVNQLRKGTTWAQDDGIELAIAGQGGTYVLRGFPDGTLRSETVAGVAADAAARLGSVVRFEAKPYGKTKGDWKSGWRGQLAIPLDALGLRPVADQKVPFNIGVYRAQDDRHLCLEGTLRENWRLDEAATLRFK